MISPDVRADGSASQSIGFVMKIGGQTFGAKTAVNGYENGVLSIGSPLASGAYAPASSLGNLAAQNGSTAFVFAPFYSELFSAAPGTYEEYGTGEFRNGEVSLITGSKLAADGAGGYLPVGSADENRGLRVSWFGLTAQPDGANPFATRYYGQIDFLDVGTRDDGDFDVLIRLGLPGEDLTMPAGALSGFSLGDQRYAFSANATNNAGWFDWIHFRGGIATSIDVDGKVVTFAAADTAVPLPGAVYLVGIGLLVGFGVNRKKH